jgi:hydrogenase-4 component E
MGQFSYELAHLLGATMLMAGFGLLYQRRLYAVLNTFAFQAFALAAAAAWQAHVQNAPHLYVTAGIALVFKAMLVPFALHWLVDKLGIHRSVDTALSVGWSMIVGVVLVALSILLVLPVTANAAALTRESLAVAMSVVLLGMLMMITRRNAVTQVVGFMALENGLLLAAVSAKGMPLVVEISVAFSVLIAMTLFGIFFFRIRERFDTLDLQYLETYRGDRQ